MKNPYDVEPSPQRLPKQRVRSPGSLYRSSSNTSVHSTKVKLQQLQPKLNAVQPKQIQPVVEKIDYTDLFHRFHSPARSSRSSSPKSPVSLHEFNMLRQQTLDKKDKALQRMRKHNHDKIMTKQLFLSQQKQQTPTKSNSKRELLVSRLLMNSSAIVFEVTKQTVRPESRQSSRKQSPSKTVNMETMLIHQINQVFDSPTFMTSPAIKLDVSKLLLQAGMLQREQQPVMMQNHSFVRDNMIELTLAIYGIDKVSNGIRVKLGKLPDDRVQAFALLLSRRMGFALSSKQKQIVRLFFKEFRVQDKKQVFKILMPSSPQSTKQSSVANVLLPSTRSSKMVDNYVSSSSEAQMKRIIVDDSHTCSDPEEYEIYEGFVNKKFTNESPLLFD